MSDDQTPKPTEPKTPAPKPGQPAPRPPGKEVRVELYGGPQDGDHVTVTATAAGTPPRTYALTVTNWTDAGPAGSRKVDCDLIVRRSQDTAGRYVEQWCYAWPVNR